MPSVAMYGGHCGISPWCDVTCFKVQLRHTMCKSAGLTLLAHLRALDPEVAELHGPQAWEVSP